MDFPLGISEKTRLLRSGSSGFKGDEPMSPMALRRRKGDVSINRVKSGIALSALDVEPPGVGAGPSPPPAKTLQSHAARVLLAGAGFLADAYDLFVINLVLRLLRDEYPQYVAAGKSQQLEGLVAAAALVGSIVGQLAAGSLADVIGRKLIFISTAVLITVGSLGSSLSVDTASVNVYTKIACWRFVLGLGVGGEYPLAATVTSESSSAGSRGKLMSAVFAMQGVGSLLSTAIVLLCLACGCSAGFTWRFALGFGSVPALLAFPWRLRMHETETFERVKRERRDVEAEAEAEELDVLADSRERPGKGEGGPAIGRAPHLLSGGRLGEIKRAFVFYKWHMLGTALSWFLLDVDFYANGLFNHEVTAVILSDDGKGGSSAADDARNSAILAIIGFPGYFLAYHYIDRVGRKNVQLLGFSVMSACFFVLWLGHDWFTHGAVPKERKYIYLFIYALTFLFSNFGPNTTSFVIPGEVYPAEVRATAHGVSAACGKLGAAFGAFFFPYMRSISDCMLACSVVAALGALCTLLFTPRYGAADLEDENGYIPLEHECLRPSEDEMAYLQALRDARSFKMVEVIDYQTYLPEPDLEPHLEMTGNLTGPHLEMAGNLTGHRR